MSYLPPEPPLNDEPVNTGEDTPERPAGAVMGEPQAQVQAGPGSQWSAPTPGLPQLPAQPVPPVRYPAVSTPPQQPAGYPGVRSQPGRDFSAGQRPSYGASIVGSQANLSGGDFRPEGAAPVNPPPTRPAPIQTNLSLGGAPPQQPPVAAAVSPSGEAPARKKPGPGWGGLIVAMLATALIAVGASVGILGNSGNSGSALPGVTGGQQLAQSGDELVPPVTARVDSPDWVAVAEAVRPATVAIAADGESLSGTGSGVIIDGEGHLITNYHVVSDVGDTGTITVQLFDGRLYEAEIVGSDVNTDLAVLQLLNPPADLVAARLASSRDLAVGQPVMAIGAPLGLSDTVTTGVISALDRPVVVSSNGVEGPQGQGAAATDSVITNAIQIDAPINPGNSGGPLFDENGSVVGINSSIASLSDSAATAGSIGLGFAIPSDLVSNVVSQILETGSVQHALLGVQITTGTAQVGDTAFTGALIAEVVPGGAAAGAGLQPDDVIVSINGDQVGSGPALTGFVRRYQAGEEVVVTIVRNGVQQEVAVTLQAKVD